MNVSIAPDLEELVREAVANDLFPSPEAVVDFALRQYAADAVSDEKMRMLTEALAEGEADAAAGRVITVRSEEHLRQLMQEP